MNVHGFTIDDETRCKHYHSAIDVIAIKFYCCNTYYPCYKCHEEVADHKIKVWPKHKFAEKAIFCGVCKTEHSITAYKEMDSCTACGAKYNDRCSLHHHLYFEAK